MDNLLTRVAYARWYRTHGTHGSPNRDTITQLEQTLDAHTIRVLHNAGHTPEQIDQITDDPDRQPAPSPPPPPAQPHTHTYTYTDPGPDRVHQLITQARTNLNTHRTITNTNPSPPPPIQPATITTQ